MSAAWLLNALAGSEGLAVATAEVPRAVLAPRQLLLPRFDAADPAHRAALAHAAAHWRHSQPAASSQGLKPLAVAVLSALEDARVERLLARDFPGTAGWFRDLLCTGPAPTGLDFAALVARLARVLADPSLGDGNPWVEKGRSLFFGVSDLEDARAFRALALVLANDLGQMRVPFDAAGYRVPAPYRDDNSYLWDHGTVAPMPDLPDLSGPPGAATVGGADATQNGGPPDGEARALQRRLYGEWDHRSMRMRQAWCTVLEEGPAPVWSRRKPPDAPVRACRPPADAWPRRPLRAQSAGEDLDLAAAVAGLVERRRGQATDGRWFERWPRLPPDTGVLLLLDASQSTAAQHMGSGCSILEAQKRMALAVARRLRGQGRRAWIHAFSSDTRAAIRYLRLLDCDTPIDRGARTALDALQPRHSTRIGAALRHALSLVQEQPQAPWAVLLLTDGAPSDIDVFDADYLVQDARAAAGEFRRAGVHLACLAFDDQASARLRTIFGWQAVALVGSGTVPVDQPHRLWPFIEGTLIA